MSNIDLNFTPIMSNISLTNGSPIKGHRAIVHPNGNVLGIVGDNYRVITNAELFERVDHAIHTNLNSSAIDTMQIIDKASRGYARTFRDIRFPEISRSITTSRHKTDVGFRIIIDNSFDGSGSVKILLGAIDFFCTNGMVHGSYDVFKKVHKGSNEIPSFDGLFIKALEQYTNKMELYQTWASKELKNQSVHRFIETLFPNENTKKNINLPYNKMGDNLLSQYITEADTRGHNVWAMYSAMTYYASHDSAQFSLNRMANDNDTTTERLHKRNDKVMSWLNSKAWSQLVAEAA
jgi:hypothetical protein